jgi:hypothetical protein
MNSTFYLTIFYVDHIDVAWLNFIITIALIVNF